MAVRTGIAPNELAATDLAVFRHMVELLDTKRRRR